MKNVFDNFFSLLHNHLTASLEYVLKPYILLQLQHFARLARALAKREDETSSRNPPTGDETPRARFAPAPAPTLRRRDRSTRRASPCLRTPLCYGTQAWSSGAADKNRGVTLLFAVAILSGILSISILIASVILGQITLIGEMADSFRALYAADQGVEKTLYLDRSSGAPFPDDVGGVPTHTESRTLAIGACYDATLSKTGGTATLTVTGSFPCGNPARLVKRALHISYTY